MSKMSELHAELQEGINDPFPTVSERKREVMQRLFDAQWDGDKEAEALAMNELVAITAKEKAGETHDPPF